MSPEREILPADLFEHYVAGRANGYASGKRALLHLNHSGQRGYCYYQKGSPYYYQDNFVEGEGRFAGYEINSQDYLFGPACVFYAYEGGLTKEGLELGEEQVYLRLRKFLAEHVSEVRFGKEVWFTFEDELGRWTYEGQGIFTNRGWRDEERLSLNGRILHELSGLGISFLPGH